MTTIAFEYRPRNSDEVLKPAQAGSIVTFIEQVEYVLSFQDDCSASIIRQVMDLGGEMLRPDTAVLGFGNFIGRADLAGVPIEVVSSKIGPYGVSTLLDEVSRLGSALVFGRAGRTGFAATVHESPLPPVPYHQFQFLREAMLRSNTGQRLQDWFGIIERSPTRRFEPDRPIVRPDLVRRLDQRATMSIFSRLDRLVPIPPESRLSTNRLSQVLTFGDPPQPHFPAKVAAPRGRLSFDTTENRFAKHLIGECLALVYRFVDHPRLHSSLRDDCRLMLGILTNVSESPFLADVGRLSNLQAPTQALAKADGYREIFSFWLDLTRHASLPLHPAEASHLLEGKDMATLYEYWVFVKVLEAALQVTGLTPSGPAAIHRDEFAESLRIGLTVRLRSDLTIRFNPTFTRQAGTAYSTPLRPDVIIQNDGVLHAFDAKYRLNRLNVEDNEFDDDPATYKRADLYKMHTYRDAVRNMKTAFVVYPGTEFFFFNRSGELRRNPFSLGVPDGVGALPLRPTDADPAANLREVLSVLL